MTPFYTAISAFANYVASGGKLVSNKTRNSRRSICDGCDKKVSVFCSECKCYLKFKTLLPSESCPIDKWDKEDDNETPAELKKVLKIEGGCCQDTTVTIEL